MSKKTERLRGPNWSRSFEGTEIAESPPEAFIRGVNVTVPCGSLHYNA
jgi:hypothetical protein